MSRHALVVFKQVQYPLEEAPCALDEAKAGRCKCNVRLETV